MRKQNPERPPDGAIFEGMKPGERRATFIVKDSTLDQFKAIRTTSGKQLKAMIDEALLDYVAKNSDQGPATETI